MNPEKNNQWTDITVAIENSMVHWQGDVPVVIKKTESISEGHDANVTAISMSAHTSTHVDAPLHFIQDGKDITEIPLESLIGPVKIFSIEDNEKIALDEIKNFPITIGDRVLFKTRNSETDWSMLDFQDNYIYLATDAAKFLKDKEVICIGIDYLSIAGKENSSEVHRTLLEKNICIIEGLNLRNIEPGNYDMICLPLKIRNADGAPARVVIRKL